MSKTNIESRWTVKLGKKFCPVSSFFLANFYRLRMAENGRSLTSTEAMLIVQLHDFKWDARAPYPTVKTLATRMGMTVRGVRNALHALEEACFIQRVPDAGGANRYHMDGLYAALEALMALDVASKDKGEEQLKPVAPSLPSIWASSSGKAA